MYLLLTLNLPVKNQCIRIKHTDHIFIDPDPHVGEAGEIYSKTLITATYDL